MNTVNFITIPGSMFADNEILVFGDRRLTYGQLNDTVARISAVFKSLGLKQRDLIAAIDTNSDNYIASYYAAARAGLKAALGVSHLRHEQAPDRQADPNQRQPGRASACHPGLRMRFAPSRSRLCRER